MHDPFGRTPMRVDDVLSGVLGQRHHAARRGARRRHGRAGSPASRAEVVGEGERLQVVDGDDAGRGRRAAWCRPCGARGRGPRPGPGGPARSPRPRPAAALRPPVTGATTVGKAATRSGWAWPQDAVHEQRRSLVAAGRPGVRLEQAHGVLLAAADHARARATGGWRRCARPDSRGRLGERRRRADRRCGSTGTQPPGAARPAAAVGSLRVVEHRARRSVSAAASCGSTSSGGVAGHLGRRRARRGDHRRALGHGLEHRQAEALAEARQAEHLGPGEEGPLVGLGHEAEPAHPAVGRARGGDRGPRSSPSGPTSTSSRPCRSRRRKASSSVGRFLRGSTVPVHRT